MQPAHPPEFSREHGCTEAEWLAWLPAAVNGRPWQQPAPGQARVPLAGGALHLAWQPLPERRIALVRLPRLQVHYRFEPGIADAERQAFMRYFDLYLQRGGG